METRTRGPKMVTYLTDKQFPMVDGVCKIFVVHVHDGDDYSVKEFSTLDDAAWYARKLKKKNYSQSIHADVEMAMTKDGRNFKTFKFTAMSF